MDNINVLLSTVILANLMLVVISSSSHRNRNEKGSVYFIYLFNIATIVWWIGSMMLNRIAKDGNIDLISKNLYASATLIASSFYYFSLIFPDFPKTNIRKLVVVSTINLGLILLVFLTPLIISGGAVAFESENTAFFGPLYPLYVLYILFFFCSSFLRLFIKHLKETDQTKKSQLLIICFGYTASGFTAFVTNLLLPFYGNFSYIWLGPTSTIFVALAVTLAVTRHHLFKIKTVTAETSVFLLWVISLWKVLAFEHTSGQLKIEHATENVAFLIIWIIAGIILIKSVKKQAEHYDENINLVNKLDLANKELRENDLVKTKFISMSRHLMASPLTAMNSYASLLKEGDLGPEKISSTSFQNVIDRFILIVRDFLNISQIEEGKVTYKKEKVDLEAVLSELLSEMKFKIEYKNIKINLKSETVSQDHNSGKDFIIQSDLEKTKTAIANVLENSIQYSENSEIIIKLFREASLVTLCVADFGVRSLPQIAPELIKKFSEKENLEEANLVGNGVGLYVARRFIEAQGNKFSIKHHENVGLWEFTLHFKV